ncbi:hypothetical protein, partial [Streptomyces sp. RKAG290]|uniref:hypothetical protein n=1 Tax=Streptomyces sp. RKAG290 TaxID=2888348 RepID=UPI002033DCE9
SGLLLQGHSGEEVGDALVHRAGRVLVRMTFVAGVRDMASPGSGVRAGPVAGGVSGRCGSG